LRSAIAADGFFDGCGRIFGTGQVGFCADKENGAAGLSEQKCRADVFSCERALNGQLVGA
jgi:hypothetical protein